MNLVKTENGEETEFNTLSGKQVADDGTSWETLKLLDDEFRSNYITTDHNNHQNNNNNNVTLMVSVEDTGIGIPEDAKSRVFTPFMQADSSTSRNYGGTGIGLSISKLLVKLMGGFMDFITRQHVGSTFFFTVEFQRCEKTAVVLDVKKSLMEVFHPTVFKGMKAVVVDGKPVRASVTRYHLKRLGIQAEIVASVRNAVALFGKYGSFISINEKLPDMFLIEKDSWLSGEEECFIQLSNNCRQNGHSYNKLPKLILLATNITSAESDKAKAVGFSDTVIMKPLRASMVAACLEQVLGVNRKSQPVKKSTSLHGLLCGKKILVVDDNAVNRRVAAGALKKFGADVHCVESGPDALKCLQIPHDFDACFMDIQMPEMDGFEATHLIREMERKANAHANGGDEWHMPILAMTADVIHATLDKCLKCGMDGYVSKPFKEKTLYQAVAKFFESKPVS